MRWVGWKAACNESNWIELANFRGWGEMCGVKLKLGGVIPPQIKPILVALACSYTI